MVSSTHAWRALGLDLTSLRVFIATAQEGSLSKAAIRENLAHSAVSRRISELEARAGVQLFDRRDRGVVLTAAGETLYGQLLDVAQMLERIALDLEGAREGITGHVRIYAHVSAVCSDLPNKIASFLQLHPGIDLELNEFTSLEVLHAVRTGVADVGFVSGTVDPQGLQTIPWQNDELVAVLPAGHELTSRSSLTLSDFFGHHFIGLQKDSALMTIFRDHSRAMGSELRVRAHAASFESVRMLVAAGLGVTILPARITHPFAEYLDIEIRPLSETWAVRPRMLCVRDIRRISTAARLLIEHLTQPEDRANG